MPPPPPSQSVPLAPPLAGTSRENTANMAQPPLKATSTIGIDVFRTGKDDFDEWVEMFEKAVKLATNAQNNDVLYPLCVDWLPLKLDQGARAVHSQAEKNTWAELKAELKGLFVDPQEAYKWQAKKKTIKWDGVESFHALAARVMSAVNKYDKPMPDAFKTREYFFRFRDALPEHYQDQIDISCGPEERTLENAKDIAQRTQMTHRGGDTAPKSVAFAAMEEDRMSGLEIAMASLSTQVENLKVTLRRNEDEIRSLKDEIRDLRSQARGPSGRSPDYRRPSGDRYESGRQNDRNAPFNRSPRPYQRGRNPSRSPSQSPSYNRGGDGTSRNGGRFNNGYRNKNSVRNNSGGRDGGRSGSGRYNSSGRDGNGNRGNYRPAGNGWDRGRDASGNRSQRDNYRAINTEDEDSGADGSDEEVVNLCAMMAQAMKANRKGKGKGN